MTKAKGFTLVEAAVAVATTGILAGMAAPLALKTLHQRREAVTRRNLKLAFEALFGARDRRVPNLRADFSFDPRDSLDALPMLTANAWGGGRVPLYGPHDRTSFFWGYNGPYWQGPVMNGLPVDGWGSPIGLRVDPDRGTWQVRSLGPDRAPGADDLVYPPIPASRASYSATVLVVVTRGGGEIAGVLTLRHGGNDTDRLFLLNQRIDPREPHQSLVFRPPAGGMELIFNPTAGGFSPFVIPMDLLPGETREVRVTL